jgi:hypothetical protein
MHRTRTILSSLVVVASALGAMGCSSSSPAPANDTPVSFAKDVMPIFQTSCTISGVCHGQPMNSGEENLYLGDNMNNTTAIIAQVYAGLVGVKSLEDPKMNLVTASDTANSYLAQKISTSWAAESATLTPDCVGNMCNAPTCTTTQPCGTSMPYNGEPLDPTTTAATINNWISQGAKNN